MEVITRRGPRKMDQPEFDALRAHYASTLVDLGTGDGAWPRRFAREHANILAIGVDPDRAALTEAAKLAERKPARGGAPNACFIAASAESLPKELETSANWITIYFPWAALLKLLLQADPQITQILNHLATPRARLSLVLNAEAVPEGFETPTPQSLSRTLQQPLAAANFRITATETLATNQAPPTTWSGRLVKASNRTMLTLEAVR